MTDFNTRSYLRLVLFDIDGTLITTNGMAKRTFADALEQVFGHPTPARTYDFSGRTDIQIYREIMKAAGADDEAIERKQDEALTTFLDLLERRITPESITVHPGIRELLDALSEESIVTLGLLTGNMLRGARIKLSPPDLMRYFSFGAFGSDAYHRHELPSIAVERAYHRTGYVFREKEIVVIGDTPHDIECGRHLNVRTIAVATGGSRREKLAEHGPDFLFDDLSDTNAVVDAIIR
ncbi:MAG: HAD family hydrolase [Bacteroidota bacterium]|nr:HAD family hydrolase [Bacteroidota bacterium]